MWNLLSGISPDRKEKCINFLLLALPVAFVTIFLIVPMAQIFVLSIFKDGKLTGEFYARFFQEGTYLKVLGLTFRISFIVTVVTLVIGYPVAYVMTISSKRTLSLIMICIMIPFWTSLLVRTYAWMVLLQTQGALNSILIGMGFIDKPLHLIYNTSGVVIGMTHVLLPYMILSLYSVMQGIDRNLISAAQNLGARPFTAFRKVYFPLSMQGIASGCILVFIMGIGYFITPSLLGGQRDTMISQLIQVQVSTLLNWNFASSIAFILLAITMLLLVVSKKIMKVEKLW
jgi:putative spermidine/putrescine transport system permease protein/spermidine/putrescine transport system permease protein